MSQDDSQGMQSYSDFLVSRIEKNYVKGFYEGLNHDWTLAANIKKLINGVDSEWIKQIEDGNSVEVLEMSLLGCEVSLMG